MATVFIKGRIHPSYQKTTEFLTQIFQKEWLLTIKNIFNPPPPPQGSLCYWPFYPSKAAVLVLFIFCVTLWIIRQALHVLKSSHALCPPVSSFFLALWSPRLGKRELVCEILVHLFVLYLLGLSFFSSLGVEGWLRFVGVALPGLFY